MGFFGLPRREGSMVAGFLLLAVVLRIVFFFASSVPGWDPSVYMAMGKYLASGGSVGFWESLRPPLLPLLIAPWALFAADLFSAVKISLAAVGLASIALSFLLLKELGRGRAALIALVMFSLMPMWAYHEGLGLSEPLTFFLVVLMLLMIRRQWWLRAGLAAGAAFLAKFPNGLLVPVVLAWLLWGVWQGAVGLRNAGFFSTRFLGGWTMVVLPYLAANHVLYGDHLFPMRLGAQVIASAGIWLYAEPWYFYLQEMVRNNLLLVLLPVLLVWVWKRRISMGAHFYLMLSLGVAYLVYFSFLGHKELRFGVLFFFLFVLCLAALLDAWWSHASVSHWMRSALWWFFLAVFVAQCIGALVMFSSAGVGVPELVPIYNRLQPNIGVIATTSPVPSAFVDSGWYLMYYPLTLPDSPQRLEEAFASLEIRQAYFSSCDLPCEDGDAVCEEVVSSMRTIIEQRLSVLFRYTIHGCDVFIAKG